jgi:hypothetical protein
MELNNDNSQSNIRVNEKVNEKVNEEIKVLLKLLGEDIITNNQYGGEYETKDPNLNKEITISLNDFNDIINIDENIDEIINKEYKIAIGNEFINKILIDNKLSNDYEIINETDLYKYLYNKIYEEIFEFLKSTTDLEITNQIKSIIYKKLLEINIFTSDLESIKLN